MNAPSVVMLKMGSYSKKRIKRLKKGKGKLRNKIEDRIEPYLAEAGKKVIPVILLYRKKDSRRGLLPLRLF